MMPVSSYVKSLHLGTGPVAEIMQGTVTVQEKVDGSQFSFQRGEDGVIHFRSKGKTDEEAPLDKMFTAASDYIRSIAERIEIGLTFRCELLNSNKHNTLAYARAPKNRLVLFDIQKPDGTFIDNIPSLESWAFELDIDMVPTFYHGPGNECPDPKMFLERDSFLGNQKVEGIVVKNYDRIIIQTGHVMTAKLVSEDFKESHAAEWRSANPGTHDIIANLESMFSTPARWNKSIQHLRDEGKLTGEMKDIAVLIPEIQEDVKLDHEAEIKQMLFDWAWKKVSRGIVHGFPEYYKSQLVAQVASKPEPTHECAYDSCCDGSPDA